MAQNNSNPFLSDGHSATRPPQFEGAHFGFWKNRMELFFQSFNPALWEIVTDGPLEMMIQIISVRKS
ncbi:hypothetical protein LINGRAHAP2_LOCUS30882 [Linum grandiflorum]